MKPRDGDDTVQDSKMFGRKVGSLATGSAGAPGRCPKCAADVPAKPGFRFSALKCPKCGAAMAKK